MNYSRNLLLSVAILFFLCLITSKVNAQDRTVTFNIKGEGVSKPITWGLDLAWISEENIRRGIAFMGSNRIDIVRSSFVPTDSIVDGALTGTALTLTNERINIINTWLGANTKVVLNSDPESIHSSFKGNPETWAELIKITTKMHQDSGRTVVSVAPFNEPDVYSAGQGSKSDFYTIAQILRGDTSFDSIRICGGNTCNTDSAMVWYTYLKDKLDEGNTHQLAGTFDHYAEFFDTVRANGDHATNDELHNIMDAMVGVEYGMQTGIWWGTAEYARGEFVKASSGVRLGYAEHRTNWTAASVYRRTDGKVQAFIGGSERQAAKTTFKFVSQDHDVFFDGYGPQREYTITYPGGIPGSYQYGQSNAERVINITWGEDVQPAINGKYILVNRKSGKVMEVANGSTDAGANIQQGAYIDSTYQQWNVTPVGVSIGGDFSYFLITAVHSGKAVDIYNWSLENNGNLDAWTRTNNGNQQWFLEYAGDGWFYIRSRFSAKCITVADSSVEAGANIMQWDKIDGYGQQWRLLPVGSPVEFTIPNAPTNLAGTSNVYPVHLTWDASTSTDVAGYTIFRAEQDGEYNTIARNVTTTSYDDTSIVSGTAYYYKINAVDSSLNHSAQTAVIGPLTAGEHVSSVDATGTTPTTTFALEQNYPNPFNPATTITYHIASKGNVLLKVYNLLGKEVATLVNEQKAAGSYQVNFHASKLASGVYFYKLQSGKNTSVKKLILMK